MDLFPQAIKIIMLNFKTRQWFVPAISRGCDTYCLLGLLLFLISAGLSLPVSAQDGYFKILQNKNISELRLRYSFSWKHETMPVKKLVTVVREKDGFLVTVEFMNPQPENPKSAPPLFPDKPCFTAFMESAGSFFPLEAAARYTIQDFEQVSSAQWLPLIRIDHPQTAVQTDAVPGVLQLRNGVQMTVPRSLQFRDYDYPPENKEMQQAKCSFRIRLFLLKPMEFAVKIA